MGIRGTVAKKYLFASLLLLLTACPELEDQNAGSDLRGGGRGNSHNGAHDGSSGGGWFFGSKKNMLDIRNTSARTPEVTVELPTDRCHAGTITFGPLDGKQVSCLLIFSSFYL